MDALEFAAFLVKWNYVVNLLVEDFLSKYYAKSLYPRRFIVEYIDEFLEAGVQLKVYHHRYTIIN